MFSHIIYAYEKCYVSLTLILTSLGVSFLNSESNLSPNPKTKRQNFNVCVCASMLCVCVHVYVSGLTLEKSGPSRENDVRVKCLPQVHVALLHRVGQHLLDPLTLLPDEVRLEQQLRSAESRPTNLRTQHASQYTGFGTHAHMHAHARTHTSYSAGCFTDSVSIISGTHT